MSGYRDAFIDANGLRLHYLEWGSPASPPVVLLHGLRGHAHAWDDVSAALAARYRVLALDQRGRGDSDWAPDGRYTADAYVADLAAFVGALALPPFVLVGHSMGGVHAMLYAGTAPAELRALVLVDIGPDSDPRGLARIESEFRNEPEEAPSLEDFMTRARPANPRVTEDVLRRRLQYQTRARADGSVGWRYDKVIREHWTRGPRPPRPALWPSLPAIACPTLVVRGAESDVLPAAVVDRMLGVLGDGRAVEIPGAGHMVFEENPRDFIAAVEQFLHALDPA